MSSLGKNINDIKYQNRAKILELLFFKGPKSRKNIAQHLGLTPAAITNITASLIEEGVIIEAEKISRGSSAGRKEQLLEINFSGFHFLLLDIDKDRYSLRVCDLEGKMISENPLTPFTAKSLFEESVLEKISNFLNENDIRLKNIKCVGISVSEDSYDKEEDAKLLFDSLKDIFEEKLQLPVFIERLSLAMVYADGVLRREKDLDKRILLRFDSVFSGALYANEADFTKAYTNSINFGSFSVEGMNGKQGFLKDYAISSTLFTNLNNDFSKEDYPTLFENSKGNLENINLKLILEAYEARDRGLVDFFDERIIILSKAISDCVNLIAPDKVLLCSTYLSNKLFTKNLTSSFRFSNEIKRPDFLLVPNYSKLLKYSSAALAINGFLESGAF